MSNFKYALLNDREQVLPYFIWLAGINDLGIRRYKRMQSFYSSPEEMYLANRTAWEKTGVFTVRQLDKLEEAKQNFDISECMDRMHRNGIELVTIDEPEYPERLKNIPSPPPFLFCKGKIIENGGPLVSVIGARECSMYGNLVASRIGELLAQAGITLISGMARGIDSIAQEACLDAGGYSLGVLGGGPDICYPKESGILYSKLESRGAIISEYAPGTNPQPQFFACRNRIISGLSDVICVIEARQKSGTMITVDSALEQGREVYALPGRITDATSSGCNELIRQGAGIIVSPEAFLEDLINNYSIKTDINKIADTKGKDRENALFQTDEKEKLLMRFLSEESFTYEELSLKTQMPADAVLSACLGLVKKQMLLSMGAGRFRLSKLGMEVRNCL